MKKEECYISAAPKDTDVRQHISYYYFHKSDVRGFTSRFTYYPHYKNAITVYKNARSNFTEKGSQVTPTNYDCFEILYSRMQKNPAQVIIEAPFQKLGIAFEPLGINHFLDIDLHEISTKPVIKFEFFGETFNKVLERVFSEKNLDQKVALLDAFFVSNKMGFSEERIKKAIHILLIDDSISVQQLSKNLDISRKTLYRLFKKHLCCSVEEYKSLLRFRKALNLYEAYLNKPKLVELAYESKYYDQSEFVKHFRTITGYNPKKFLSDISRFGKQDTFWTLN